MLKKEYIESVTKKVFDSSAKKSLTAELEAHIDEKTDFYKEIGYEAEISEEKATEAMGETDEIAEQFGELHNDFYNPAGDVILTILFCALLGGIYFLLKKYAFTDGVLTSLSLGAVCLSFALVSCMSFISLRKNKPVAMLLSALFIGTAGVFDYFVMVDIEKKMNGSFQNLTDFIFKSLFSTGGSYVNEKRIIGIICILSVLAVVTVLFSLIYYIKVKNLANKKIDNKAKHFFTGLSATLTVFGLVLCVLFCVKTAADLKMVKNEYIAAYDYVIEMAEKCTSKEEIIRYLDKSDYDFEITKEDDGEITAYSYMHNLISCEIEFPDIESREAIAAQKKKENKELMKKFEKNASLRKFAEVMQGDIDLESEEEYYSQEFCRVHFTNRTQKIGSTYNSASAAFLKVAESDEDKFYDPELRKLTKTQHFDYFKPYCPITLNLSFDLSNINSCTCEFEYLFGTGAFKHTEKRYAVRPDKNTADFYEKANKAIRIVGDNRKASYKQIAKLTGAKLDKPAYSKEEWEEQVNMLGRYFNSIKDTMIAQYDLSVKYRFDDWYFVLKNQPYEEIYVYNKYGNYVFDYSFTQNQSRINYTDPNEVEKKVFVGGVFYDKKGYFYTSSDYIRYYTKSGATYYYYRKTIEDKTHTVGDTKEYYLTDRKKNFYKAEDCYINQDGYLCLNVGNLTYDKKTKKYKSPSGEEYTKALETSWDEKGNVILQSDEYETSVLSSLGLYS